MRMAIGRAALLLAAALSVPFARSTVLPARADQDPSTIVLTASATTIGRGAPVTFTATVAGNGACAPLAGDVVVFSIDGAQNTSAQLNASLQASFSIASLASGAHTVTAQYQGNSSCASSMASIGMTVLVQAATTTTLSANLLTAPGSAAVGIAVTVAGVAPPCLVATGAVMVFDAITNPPLAIAVLPLSVSPPSPLARASLLTTSLVPGTHLLSAQYGGDANCAPSNSPQVTVTVPAGDRYLWRVAGRAVSVSPILRAEQMRAGNKAGRQERCARERAWRRDAQRQHGDGKRRVCYRVEDRHGARRDETRRRNARNRDGDPHRGRSGRREQVCRKRGRCCGLDEHCHADRGHRRGAGAVALILRRHRVRTRGKRGDGKARLERCIELRGRILRAIDREDHDIARKRRARAVASDRCGERDRSATPDRRRRGSQYDRAGVLIGACWRYGRSCEWNTKRGSKQQSSTPDRHAHRGLLKS